jgi:hypothetical protein
LLAEALSGQHHAGDGSDTWERRITMWAPA